MKYPASGHKTSIRLPHHLLAYVKSIGGSFQSATVRIIEEHMSRHNETNDLKKIIANFANPLHKKLDGITALLQNQQESKLPKHPPTGTKKTDAIIHKMKEEPRYQNGFRGDKDDVPPADTAKLKYPWLSHGQYLLWCSVHGQKPSEKVLFYIKGKFKNDRLNPYTGFPLKDGDDGQ